MAGCRPGTAGTAPQDDEGLAAAAQVRGFHEAPPVVETLDVIEYQPGLGVVAEVVEKIRGRGQCPFPMPTNLPTPPCRSSAEAMSCTPMLPECEEARRTWPWLGDDATRPVEAPPSTTWPPRSWGRSWPCPHPRLSELSPVPRPRGPASENSMTTTAFHAQLRALLHHFFHGESPNCMRMARSRPVGSSDRLGVRRPAKDITIVRIDGVNGAGEAPETILMQMTSPLGYVI